MAKLVLMSGSQRGQEFTLSPLTTIGSAAGNTVLLKHVSIAPLHAVLELRSGAWSLAPAEADRVVQVNGALIGAATPVTNGDIVQLGDVTAMFCDKAPMETEDLLGGPESSRTLEKLPPPERLKSYSTTEQALEAVKTNERLQRHLETLYEASAIACSTLDPRELTKRLFILLYRVLKPDRIFLLRYDELGHLNIAAQNIDAKCRTQGAVKVSRSILREVVRSHEALLIKCIDDDERFRRRDSVVEQNIQTVLCAPLIKQDQLLGILYLDRLTGPRSYQEDDLHLLTAIAWQLAVGWENARMYERNVELNRKVAALGEAARAMSAGLDREAIIRSAVDSAARTFDCKRCSVLLYNEAEEVLEMAYSTSIDRSLWPQIRVKPGEDFSGRAFSKNAPLLVPDVRRVMGSGRPGYDSSSFLIVPITIRAGQETRPIGVIALTDKMSGKPFELSDQELMKLFTHHVGTSLATASLEGDRKLIEHEMRIASDIQRRLLPRELPPIAGYDFRALYVPHGQVGGDYYDVLRVGRDLYGIVVADVAGEGIPAALTMTELRALVRAEAPRANTPGELMTVLNRVIFKDVPRGMFVTAVYLILDVAGHRIRFASCGHPPMLLWKADESRLDVLDLKSLALALDEGSRFEDELKERELVLAPGDRLVLYTDGLIEATNPRGEPFEVALREYLPSICNADSQHVVEGLKAELDAFRNNLPVEDDLTVITLRRL